MEIKITQKGKYKAFNNNGVLISEHSTDRIALETVINAGGGYYESFDKIEVKIIDSEIKTPDSVNVSNINFN